MGTRGRENPAFVQAGAGHAKLPVTKSSTMFRLILRPPIASPLTLEASIERVVSRVGRIDRANAVVPSEGLPAAAYSGDWVFSELGGFFLHARAWWDMMIPPARGSRRRSDDEARIESRNRGWNSEPPAL